MATQFPRPDTPDDPDSASYPEPRRDGPTYSLFAVAGLLGQRDRAPRWLIAYLDQLAIEESFPKPLPLLKAGELVRTAQLKSQWPAAAVHAWLDGTIPPDLASGVDRAMHVAASNRLDARAEQLGRLQLVGGTEA